MDSESLGQIKHVAKEAAKEVWDDKMDSLADKLEGRVRPQMDKLTSLNSLCDRMLTMVTALKSEDASKIKDGLDDLKTMLRNYQIEVKRISAVLDIENSEPEEEAA